MGGKLWADVISRYVNVTGDLVTDAIIFLVILVSSVYFAFIVFGKVFYFFVRRYTKLKSIVDYILRFVIFFVLLFLFIKLAKLISWLFIPPASYFLLLVIAVGITLFIVIRKRRIKRF